ncbi:hypothetical protein TNIN_66711 [Trichonephila inaurata madagascariensis]|uniref:Uncharacterized protein n=1 Tax=Trichonephila inaurata madagascariensis TaxID=2747483 RepID=A0A8X7BTC8_9ARAC|nr:hypothetical protein TNIN_66711 [Trichonephila inaurata madagascariensis]
MILLSLNCQSLRAHARDLRGNIVQNAHILMSSETWLRNEEVVEIENFKCLTQYGRPSINQGGGVAIYQNVRQSHKFISNHDDFVRKNTQSKVSVNLKCRVALVKSYSSKIVTSRLESVDPKNIFLGWIKGSNLRWKSFLAIQNNGFQSLPQPHSGFHCPSKENLADLVSRGTSATQFLVVEWIPFLSNSCL